MQRPNETSKGGALPKGNAKNRKRRPRRGRGEQLPIEVLVDGTNKIGSLTIDSDGRTGRFDNDYPVTFPIELGQSAKQVATSVRDGCIVSIVPIERDAVLTGTEPTAGKKRGGLIKLTNGMGRSTPKQSGKSNVQKHRFRNGRREGDSEGRSVCDTSKLLDWIPEIEQRVQKQSLRGQANFQGTPNSKMGVRSGFNEKQSDSRRERGAYTVATDEGKIATVASKRLEGYGDRIETDPYEVVAKLPPFYGTQIDVFPGLESYFVNWWNAEPLCQVLARCSGLSRILMEIELEQMTVGNGEPDAASAFGDSKTTRRLIKQIADIVKSVNHILETYCLIIRPDRVLLGERREQFENKTSFLYTQNDRESLVGYITSSTAADGNLKPTPNVLPISLPLPSDIEGFNSLFELLEMAPLGPDSNNSYLYLLDLLKSKQAYALIACWLEIVVVVNSGALDQALVVLESHGGQYHNLIETSCDHLENFLVMAKSIPRTENEFMTLFGSVSSFHADLLSLTSGPDNILGALRSSNDLMLSLVAPWRSPSVNEKISVVMNQLRTWHQLIQEAGSSKLPFETLRSVTKSNERGHAQQVKKRLCWCLTMDIESLDTHEYQTLRAEHGNAHWPIVGIISLIGGHVLSSLNQSSTPQLSPECHGYHAAIIDHKKRDDQVFEQMHNLLAAHMKCAIGMESGETERHLLIESFKLLMLTVVMESTVLTPLQKSAEEMNEFTKDWYDATSRLVLDSNVKLADSAGNLLSLSNIFHQKCVDPDVKRKFKDILTKLPSTLTSARILYDWTRGILHDSLDYWVMEDELFQSPTCGMVFRFANSVVLHLANNTYGNNQQALYQSLTLVLAWIYRYASKSIPVVLLTEIEPTTSRFYLRHLLNSMSAGKLYHDIRAAIIDFVTEDDGTYFDEFASREPSHPRLVSVQKKITHLEALKDEYLAMLQDNFTEHQVQYTSSLHIAGTDPIYEMKQKAIERVIQDEINLAKAQMLCEPINGVDDALATITFMKPNSPYTVPVEHSSDFYLNSVLSILSTFDEVVEMCGHDDAVNYYDCRSSQELTDAETSACEVCPITGDRIAVVAETTVPLDLEVYPTLEEVEAPVRWADVSDSTEEEEAMQTAPSIDDEAAADAVNLRTIPEYDGHTEPVYATEWAYFVSPNSDCTTDDRYEGAITLVRLFWLLDLYDKCHPTRREYHSYLSQHLVSHYHKLSTLIVPSLITTSAREELPLGHEFQLGESGVLKAVDTHRRPVKTRRQRARSRKGKGSKGVSNIQTVSDFFSDFGAVWVGGSKNIGKKQRAVGSETQRAQRHILVDASNIAMNHGKDSEWSSEGLKLAVDHFKAKGYKVQVFLPEDLMDEEMVAKAYSLKHNPVMDASKKERVRTKVPTSMCILKDLQDVIVKCPAHDYDDSYMLVHAQNTGACILSNDRFKDYLQKLESHVSNGNHRDSGNVARAKYNNFRNWLKTHRVSFTFAGSRLILNPDFMWPDIYLPVTDSGSASPSSPSSPAHSQPSTPLKHDTMKPR